MLCFSICFVASRARKAGPKSCEGSAAQDADKICTTSARESDSEVKIDYKHRGFGALFEVELTKICIASKTGMPGALLEVELRKSCATPVRESDLEVKIVKNWRSRDVFGSSKCFSRGRRRDFDTLQKYVAGAGVRAGCKNVGRRGGFEEGLMLFAWQAQPVTGVRMPRLNFFVAIVETYWNSEVKCLVDMSFLKEVSQKCFVFDIQSFIFEGSLAEMLRFWSSKLDFWRKSRRNASFLIFNAGFLKEVSQKRKSPTWVNPKLVDNQIIWIPNHLTTKSFDSQFIWTWRLPIGSLS